ncbi:MAG: STAS domain-containing protein [Bacilli bacterium]|nr:STAS domain-containing protein [Bacilli bacterium]
MKITKKQNGSELVLELEGSLNTSTSPMLDGALKDSLNGIKLLVIDFEKVDYVSSAGLRVLLMAHKTMLDQGKLVLKHVNQNVLDVFNMTGFDEFLNIEN